MKSKKLEKIRKNPEESEEIINNPKGSDDIRRCPNPKESERIRKNFLILSNSFRYRKISEDSGRFRKNLEESETN